jgi:DNA-binding transcriptional ArsR family regulator|tara:strand:- start:12731 stop:13078 length:348 start_codon:yes stop_codon:yes gene_type:complete
MEIKNALAALSALSQQTRLEIFRLLVKKGADGLAAGDIADVLDVRPNTLSANLVILVNAGLLRNERQGRSIRYFVDMQGMRTLLSFLLEDCCGGHPELCQPVISEIFCDCGEGEA